MTDKCLSCKRREERKGMWYCRIHGGLDMCRDIVNTCECDFVDEKQYWDEFCSSGDTPEVIEHLPLEQKR